MKASHALFIAWFALCPAAFAAPAVQGLSAENIQPVSLWRHSANTYYLKGSIGSYGDTDLLIDTGSSALVINETILAKLKDAGQAEYINDMRGTMADGSVQVVPIYRIQQIRLGASCWVENVEAAVFAGNARPILGMGLLARLAPFTFSTEPAQLQLSNCVEQGRTTTTSFSKP